MRVMHVNGSRLSPVSNCNVQQESSLLEQVYYYSASDVDQNQC